MKSLTTPFTRRLLRRGQAGQSIVILAFAFVALLAFVGIVTDVSLLFVRYSTLQRAVDSASVAAATQFRRILDDNPAEDIDTGLSSSYTQMSLAARTFIESYGLDPDDVAVETCQVQLTPFDESSNTWLFDSNPWFDADTAEARSLELCTADQRKLVRVTARMNMPTVFLRVIGVQDFPLIVDSISETAVLDVMMIIDVSESMRDQTFPETYVDNMNEIRNELTNRGLSTAEVDGLTTAVSIWETRYLPGRVPVIPWVFGGTYSPAHQWWQGDGAGLPNSATPTEGLMELTQNQIDDYLENDAPDTATVTDFNLEALPNQANFTYYLRHVPFQQGQSFPTTAFNMDRVYDPDDTAQPRYECRVRFWPFAHRSETIPDPVLDEYIDYLGSNTQIRQYFNMPSSLPVDTDDEYIRNTYMTYRGFVPTYNFYGCCNDPNGDGDFTDLVCEPFKTARDETLNFLDRIDFLRGDRVGFVTFDRRAYLFDVNGSSEPGGFMIDNQIQAEAILEKSIGVRSEATFYADNSDLDDILAADSTVSVPLWDNFVIGESTYASFDYRPGSPNYFNSTAVGEMTFFPNVNNCPFDMAAITYPFSNYDPSLLLEIYQPRWYTGDGSANDAELRSYEYRGSCAGTNIGASLSVASQALGTPIDEGGGRTEGAVWIMVLLSDGAAGASNPVLTNGFSPQLARPYLFDPVTGDPASEAERVGDYGAFSLCPYPRTAFAPDDFKELISDRAFPYCSDELPQTRDYCQQPQTVDPIPNNPNYLDLGNDTANGFPDDLCEQTYDVDDYARDWADFVSGATLPEGSAAQLPTIFTIGFGLDFSDCGACLEETLGEELLRYIADAGDNNRVDDDYWQTALGAVDILPDPNELPVSERAAFYGQLGPCEADDGNPTAYGSVTPGETCGNYFNAAGGADLEIVFNEIASRMFTRLSQ
jgi:hypothetical protein